MSIFSVMVLPELGGRIQRAYDKTNGYDFVYYNRCDQAGAGRTGRTVDFREASSSTGPSTTDPPPIAAVDCARDGKRRRQQNPWSSVNEVDQMYGTKGIA